VVGVATTAQSTFRASSASVSKRRSFSVDSMSAAMASFGSTKPATCTLGISVSTRACRRPRYPVPTTPIRRGEG
jgi:hypothetical protein